MVGVVHTIQGVATSTTAFVGRTRTGPVRMPNTIGSFAEFERVYGGLWSESPMSFAVRQYFDNGGSTAVIVRVFARRPPSPVGGVVVDSGDGRPLSSADILGAARGRTGIYALLDADGFNILCLPPPAPNAEIDQVTWTRSAKFCQEHRAILILDAADDTPANIKSSGPAMVSIEGYKTNAALFYPRIRLINPLSTTNALENFAPCGAAAGVFSRTDANRGVWKAPAGIEAALNAKGVTQPINDSINGELNTLGINCLRTFPSPGTVIWGARTMAGADAQASEWKYIPVRRTALFMEESVYRGTSWTVSEPNGEPVWAEVRSSVGVFMQNLFRQGAFAGLTPREAYFVKCDSDTTTTADIVRGVINLVIGFAPLKPAEFVIIRLQLGARKTPGVPP